MGEHAGCCETQRRGITPRLGGREGFLEEATFTMKWSEPGREVGGGESVPWLRPLIVHCLNAGERDWVIG